MDGACEPRNPGGTACYGFVVKSGDKTLVAESGVVGSGKEMSNNVSEYAALAAVLRWLLAKGLRDEEIVVKSDSRLVVNQLSGRWRVRGGLYLSYYLRATGLARLFSRIRFVWIPREDNERADALSRAAYEEWCKAHGRVPLYVGRAKA